MALWDLFRRKDLEDDFTPSHRSKEALEEKAETTRSNFGYRYLHTLPSSNAMLFTILDEDEDVAGHILCTTEGKISVLFDNRWDYAQSDVDDLRAEVRKFFDAL